MTENQQLFQVELMATLTCSLGCGTCQHISWASFSSTWSGFSYPLQEEQVRTYRNIFPSTKCTEIELTFRSIQYYEMVAWGTCLWSHVTSLHMKAFHISSTWGRLPHVVTFRAPSFLAQSWTSCKPNHCAVSFSFFLLVIWLSSSLLTLGFMKKQFMHVLFHSCIMAHVISIPQCTYPCYHW